MLCKGIHQNHCEEIKDDVFWLLVDGSSDVSPMEQMAVVVTYVDKLEVVKENFIKVVHVTNTTPLLTYNQLRIYQVSNKFHGIVT